ncbi:D-arginine dehydrogenase [Sphingomonas sp. F9_3S_D5_B_2]
MTHFDVAIVGGGIAGASLGARIASAVRTVIFEAEENCATHATGRSAAFWLAHYGGTPIIPLSIASRPLLESGWPAGDHSFLRQRGCLTIAREGMDLRDALSVASDRAPRRGHLRRRELEGALPGLLPGWDFGLHDPSCADIDVAGLHNACLASFGRAGGRLVRSAPLRRAERRDGRWHIEAGADRFSADVLVDAAGAWADDVAARCGVAPLDIRPYRRTIVQLRMGRSGLRDLPLVIDALGRFYFKGEGDNRLWVSPHDETAAEPCDAVPEEIDVATAIDQLQSVVDWPIEAVEHKWAGLRSFTPSRVPAYGFDSDVPGFFWCAGQGGFGIQTAPAASALAAALLIGTEPEPFVADIDPAVYAPQQLG